MAKAKGKGLFIVTDGMDGAGKSTQARLLAAWLKSKGKKVLLIHEPSRKTKLGRYITALTKSKAGAKLTNKEWVDLFTRERKESLAREILPALKKGKTILLDRYYYSTLAYQLPAKRWKSYVKQFLRPSITLIFDLPADTALKRRKKVKEKGKLAVFEKLKLLEQLRKKYLKMKCFKEVKIIDAQPSIKEVFVEVQKEVGKII